MKKNSLVVLFTCALFYNSSAYITLYGQYKRISLTSFFCALISTQFCARVQEPPDEFNGQWFPHRNGNTTITTFDAAGSVIETIEVTGYSLTNRDGGTLVSYSPVELP